MSRFSNRSKPRGERLTGFHSVYEALRAGKRRIHAIHVSASQSPETKSKSKVLQDLAQKKEVALVISPRGKQQGQSGAWVYADAAPYPYTLEKDLEELMVAESLVIFCDRIQDPQNLGSIFRTFYALGGNLAIITRRDSAEVTPAVSRASAGGVEHLRVVQVGSAQSCLNLAREAGLQTVGAVAQGGTNINELQSPRTLLILGNEGEGLRSALEQDLDARVTIPIRPGFDSLNVAASAAILAFRLMPR